MLKGTGYDVQNGLAYNSSFLNSGRIGNFERERDTYIFIYIICIRGGLFYCVYHLGFFLGERGDYE